MKPTEEAAVSGAAEEHKPLCLKSRVRVTLRIIMYGIAQVEEISGISAFTIRYYDKCGFFPNLQRDAHGARVFGDADIEQLKLVDALRKSGLSIEGIQYFVKSLNKEPSNPDCLEVLKDRLKVLEIKKAEIDASAAMIEKAIDGFGQVDEPNASDLMDF